MTRLRFAPVTAENWRDLETLFEKRGAPKHCWCMVWRPLPQRQSASNADRKRAMEAIVGAGMPVGLLAFAGADPVGWCSVAPRESLRELSPQQDDGKGKVWSVVCFFILREYRRKGVASALLDAATAYAFASGAGAVEAYPVDPDSPSYRFMGFCDMFSARGFRHTGMAGARRHVMRLEAG